MQAAFEHKEYLATLAARPGVYRMLDATGELLYVGKAKNLKARVSSYFRSRALDAKTLALVARVAGVESTVTQSETEALLLEQSIIKAYRPPYNISFRDDKSYPYIYLSSQDQYPRLAFHRGAQKRAGRYFGPFPSAASVRDSLNVMQKVFQVRQCEDSFFRNRSRPCLQYQIKRCSGPCCGLVSQEDYAESVRHAVMFLTGKSSDVLRDYASRMDEAAQRLDFERAAQYRDQVGHLRRIQEQQYVVAGQGDIDVHAVAQAAGGVCVLVAFIRAGRMLGHKIYFPKTRLDEDAAEVLAAFLPLFYLDAKDGKGGRETPDEIVLSHRLADKAALEEALSAKAGQRVQLLDRVRSHRRRWIDLALANAEQSLGAHLASRNNLAARFAALAEALGLDEPPARLECFDVSHTGGEATVASCVVFDREGPRKSDYRLFNIEGVTPGDDYAALAQALSRRYTRIKKGEGRLPDLLFVDGGKGQLSAARQVLEELQVDEALLVGVAKGPGRKAGLETLILADGSKLALAADDPALHLVQQIRDESHRFAITGHRNRRKRKRSESLLEGIEGIGPKRRRALLRHFGSAQQVRGASAEELAKVEGVNARLAEQIYAALH